MIGKVLLGFILVLAGFVMFCSPLAAALFFIDSLFWYCSDKRRQKKDPEAVTTQELASRKTRLIVSILTVVVLTAVFVGFWLMPASGVPHM